MKPNHFHWRNFRTLRDALPAADRSADDLTTLTRENLVVLLTAVVDFNDEEASRPIIEQAAESLAQVFPNSGCSLFPWDESSKCFRLQFIAGRVPALGSESIYLSDLGYARQDLEAGLAVQFLFPGESLTARPVLLLPWLQEGRLAGLAVLPEAAVDGPELADRVKAGLLILHEMAAAAVRRAARQAAERRAEQMQQICEGGLALAAELDRDEILDAILATLQSVFPDTSHASIFLYQENKLSFAAACWGKDGGSPANAAMRPTKMIYQSARSGRPVVWDSVRGPFRNATSGRPETAATLPLKIGDMVVGVLSVHHAGSGSLNTAELRVLEMLANQAALAIENARLHQIAQQQALTDSLTGLPNRRALDSRLDEELRRSSRYRHPFTLLMLDLNNFKPINDTFGHPAGDMVLQQVAGCLRCDLRDTDFLARYGGDEFAIILPETDLSTAEKMVARIEELSPECRLEPNIEAHTVSLSIGMALYPRDAITASGLLIAADQALYRVKAAQKAAR